MDCKVIEKWAPYMEGRPSFKRFKNKYKKEYGVEPTKELYRALGRATRVSDISTLEELAAISNVDMDSWDIQKLVINKWADQTQVKATLSPKYDAPVFRRAGLDGFVFEVSNKPVKGERVFVVPDAQIGFIGDTPTHNIDAMNLCLSLIGYTKPTSVVLIGDMLDLAPMSKFRKDPQARYTTQRSLDVMWTWLVNLRKIFCGPIYYLEGNHEARYRNSMLDNGCDEYVGLCRAGEQLPVNSLPYLLRLDELSVEYIGPWGAEVELDGVSYTHGDKWGKHGGQTVAKYLTDATNSIVVGHAHKLELAYKSHPKMGYVWAMCGGTLADPKTTPGCLGHKDWHYGCAMVECRQPTLIPFSEDGKSCVFRGKSITTGSSTTA